MGANCHIEFIEFMHKCSNMRNLEPLGIGTNSLYRLNNLFQLHVSPDIYSKC